jgi:DNA-binding CsgD family transcriptional regulator/PAS domain-containing protein
MLSITQLGGDSTFERALLQIAVNRNGETVGMLSDVVARVYAAAADPTLWRSALIAIERYTGSAGSLMHLLSKQDVGESLTVCGSIEQELCAEYVRDYLPICPRVAFVLDNPHVPIQYDALHMSEREMDRDPVYDFYARHGFRYYVGAPLGEIEAFTAAFSLQRLRKQGHASMSDIDAVRQIQPHLREAVIIAEKLGTLSDSAALGRALLDSRAEAIFALDGSGRVVLMNRSAEELVRREDPLMIADGRLACRSAAQQSTVDKIIAGALADPPRVRGWVPLDRVHETLPLMARAAPVPLPEAAFHGPRPRLLLIVHDPRRRTVAEPSDLRYVFGLTDAEARVAHAIASGHTATSAARLLAMSHETLRWHLKKVFRKTHVRTQQDLVAMLSNLP